MDGVLHEILSQNIAFLPFEAGLLSYLEAPNMDEALIKKEELGAVITTFSITELRIFSDALFDNRREFVGIQKMRILEAYSFMRNIADMKRFNEEIA